MTDVAFVDIETTGLDPDRHVLWEVALIVDGDEYEFHVRPDLTHAEEGALRINRYYQRTYEMARSWDWDVPAEAAVSIASLTAGRHLVGAAPWFDAGFLDQFLRRWRHAPAWHHRLICVETYAAGHYGWSLPKSLRDTAETLGIIVPDSGRHTAIGDARTAKLIYEQLVRGEILEDIDLWAAPAPGVAQ